MVQLFHSHSPCPQFRTLPCAELQWDFFSSCSTKRENKQTISLSKFFENTKYHFNSLTANLLKSLFTISFLLSISWECQLPQFSALTLITNSNPALLLWSDFPSLQTYSRLTHGDSLCYQETSSLLVNAPL